MNNLLIFFALPIATIIISIALQKILKCPYLVSAIVFAIFLIVTFIINNLNFLVATIVYTIISFITALIVCLACRIIESLNGREGCFRNCRRNSSNNNNTVSDIENINDILSINGEYTNNGNNGVITVNALNNSSNNGCNCNSNNNRVSARINVIPNSNTNGRTGCLCGNYRRS